MKERYLDLRATVCLLGLQYVDLLLRTVISIFTPRVGLLVGLDSTLIRRFTEDREVTSIRSKHDATSLTTCPRNCRSASALIMFFYGGDLSPHDKMRMHHVQCCSGAGTHRNAIPVNILGRERRSGNYPATKAERCCCSVRANICPKIKFCLF